MTYKQSFFPMSKGIVNPFLVWFFSPAAGKFPAAGREKAPRLLNARRRFPTLARLFFSITVSRVFPR
jgi:hypothetical protein